VGGVDLSENCHQHASRKTCPAQRQAFFCFVFFVATKKMTLLSGNPDDFVFAFEGKVQHERATD